MAIGAADERRRADPAVAETWRFDVADPATGLGAVVRVAYRPTERVAWCWLAAVGCGPPLVALRAHDVAIPVRGTDVRTDGLWVSLQCETPLEHWSVGVECFGVGYDDPWDALAGERGDLIPFGIDLEWEGDEPPTPRPGGGGYGQWCTVTGEILLGDDRIDVTATGHREHTWGPAAELQTPSVRLRGRGWGAPDPAGLPEATVLAVAPFAVPGRPWIEQLCRTDEGGGGWVGYTRS